MSSSTVIVSGMVAATPGQGGASWAVLQYLLGLRRLGCDAYLVEPIAGGVSTEVTRYCDAVMRRFGLDGTWALLPPDGAEPAGMSRDRLRRVAGRADLLLNVAGMLTDEDTLERVPVRAYLDLDPVFTQFWHETEGVDMRFDAHTDFVSISDSIGAPEGAIPDCGREWLPTLPPVVLDQWPLADAIEHRAATTVGHWRSYGSVHRDGVHYGQKVHSLRTLIDLPRRAPGRFALALAIHPDEVADIAALDENGWDLLDPADVAASPDEYRDFVQGSWAELGLTKSGYVAADSGWFSDRSCCYLASGRPVIAQDTGFGRRLPTGDGLLSFTTADDVLVALDELDRDYESHRRAARQVAEEHLDSDRVLTRLLERLCR